MLSTSTPINHIVFLFCRIPVVLENRRSSQGGGGGVRTPCTLPLDPPLLVASLCCFLIFLLFLFSEVSMLDFCFTYISSSFYFFNEEMLRKNNGKRSSFTEVMQYYLLVARKKKIPLEFFVHGAYCKIVKLSRDVILRKLRTKNQDNVHKKIIFLNFFCNIWLNFILSTSRR